MFSPGKPFDNKMPLPGRRGEPLSHADLCPFPAILATRAGRGTARPVQTSLRRCAGHSGPGPPAFSRRDHPRPVKPGSGLQPARRSRQPGLRQRLSAGHACGFVDRSAPGAMQVALTRDQIIQLTETGNPAWREKYLSAHRPVQQDRRLANAASGGMNSLSGASRDLGQQRRPVRAGRRAAPRRPASTRPGGPDPAEPGDPGYADKAGWEALYGHASKPPAWPASGNDLSVRNGSLRMRPDNPSFMQSLIVRPSGATPAPAPAEGLLRSKFPQAYATRETVKRPGEQLLNRVRPLRPTSGEQQRRHARTVRR